MGKTIWIISIIVILIIAISLIAFLIFPIEQNNSQQSTITKDPVDFIGNCDTLSGFEKEQCLIQKASLTQNIEICSQVEPKNKEGCIGDVAINARNPSLCNGLSNPEGCKEAYAMNVLDSTYCGETGICKTTVQRWLTKYTLQYSDCEELNTKVKNSAFSGTNDYTKQQQCFEFVAFLELESQYCDKVEYTAQAKEQCKDKAQRKDFTSEKCSTRMGYGHYRDVCYYQLAKQENSKLFCDKIVLNVLKDRCIDTFN